MSLIIPANTLASGGYAVDNSLRFNGSNDSLVRTPSSSGSTTINTWSFWVKRSELDSSQTLYSSEVSSSNVFKIGFTSNTLEILFYVAPAYRFQIKTNRLFRDVSAFYNIVIIQNAGASTNTDRLQIWVNGVRETSFAITNFPDADEGAAPINASSVSQNIGTTGTENFGGYMSEVVHIDGTAYAASDFGEFDEDSGIFKPIDVSGLTFGTNGSYFQFKETGTSQNSSGMGADTSGEDNHYAVNNLTAIDQSIDTCTNNGATVSPLVVIGNTGQTYADGNLTFNASGNNWTATNSTIGASQGNWYAEFKVVTLASSTGYGMVGVTGTENITNGNFISTEANSVGLGLDYRAGNNVAVYSGGSFVQYAGADFAAGAIVGIAVDMDNKKFYLSHNGTYLTVGGSVGDPTSGSTGTGALTIPAGIETFLFAVGGYSTSFKGTWNFGSPAYAISSGNQDPNGYGNFEYPTNGYYALNTKNLAEYG